MTTVDRTGCPATRHGTSSAYRHKGCRCPDAVALMRAIWRGRPDRGPSEPDPLNVEIAIYRARRCVGPPPLINTAERRAVVAALTKAGWTAHDIGAALGLDKRTVGRHLTTIRSAA